MATADEVLITVRTKGVKAAGADIDRTRKKLEGLGRAARGVGKDVRRTTREMERLTSAASGLSVADALGMSSRGRRSGSGGIEDARSSLARMRSDVGKTNALLRQMDLRGPKRSPFAVPEIVGSARRLEGFNRTAQRTVSAMRAVRGATTGSGSGSGAAIDFGAGGHFGADVGRLDRPAGASGRAAPAGWLAARGTRRPTRSGSRTDARTWKLAAYTTNGLSLAESGPGGTKAPNGPATTGEARREFGRTIKTPLTDQLTPSTQGREERFDPAVIRMFGNATAALLRVDPVGMARGFLRDGKDVGAAFGDLSLGDKLATAFQAPVAAWGVAQATKLVKKGATNALKTGAGKVLAPVAARSPAVARAAGLARGFAAVGGSWGGLATLGFAAAEVADRQARNRAGMTFNDYVYGRSGRPAGNLFTRPLGTLKNAVSNGPIGDLGRGVSSFLGGGKRSVREPAYVPARQNPPSAAPWSKPQPVRSLQPVARPVRSLQPVPQPTPAVRTPPRSNKKWSPPAIPSYGGLKAFGRATGGTVRPGELTLVGEQGPEIARFPAGTQITSNRDTRAKAAGAASASRGRARDRVVRETPLNLSLDGQVFYRAVSRQTELVELRG